MPNCHYSTPQRVAVRITVCDRLLCYVEEVIEIRRTALLLLLVVSGAAFVAGCGGDDSSEETAAPVTTTTPETATLTQDELIAQGDDLCSSVNAAVGTIDASSTTDESLKASQISQIYAGLADDLVVERLAHAVQALELVVARLPGAAVGGGEVEDRRQRVRVVGGELRVDGVARRLIEYQVGVDLGRRL